MSWASDLLSGVASYEQGSEEASLYRANAAIAGAQAQSEEAAGAYNESAVRMRGAATIAQQVASTGANNLQQVGTPAQVIASTAQLNEMDALTVRNNALRRAWGYRVQQANDLTQSNLVARAGAEKGLSSILGGVGGAAKDLGAFGRANPYYAQKYPWLFS